MRIAVFGFTTMASLAFAAMPAQAQGRDAVASTAIAEGNYAHAESALLKELRIHPGRPELLLNLAAVYARTGRVGEARYLYRQVLSQDDILMDLSTERTMGSHSLATVGLRRLDTNQLTAR